MIGKTNSQTGGAIKGEKLNISLKTNQASGNELLGVVITVTHAGGATNYVWEGYEMTVDIPPYLEYTLTFSGVEGYKTPVLGTFTAVPDNSRSVVAEYLAEKASVSLAADDASDMSGTSVNVAGKDYTYNGSPIEVLIPYGTQYSITPGAKFGYGLPAVQTFTASLPSRDIMMNYVLSTLQVNILSNQGTDSTIAAVKATVSYSGSSVELSNGGIVGIPADTEITVSFPDVEGYKKPENIVFTNSGGKVVKEVTYQTTVITASVKSNQSSTADVADAVVSIGDKNLKNGESAKFATGSVLTAMFSSVTGYATPSSQSITASGTAMTVTGTYNSTFVTVVMADNQPSLNDIAGATATVAASGITTQTVNDGGVVKVPTGVSCTVTWNAVTDYKTPSAQTFTTSGTAMTKTGTYQTELVSVTLSADNGSSVNGAVVTINGVSHTWNGTTITQKVAFDKIYDIVPQALDGFATPASQTDITANQASRQVTLTYIASALEVSIKSNQNSDSTIAAVKATVAYGSTSVEVGDGETIAIPTNTDVTVTYPAVTGYKTPAAVTINNTGGTKTASGTYYTEVVTVTVSADNSADVSGQVVTINGTGYTWAGTAISVKIPYDTTYTVSVSDKDGYTTPASQTFTASQTGRNLSLQYVYNPYKMTTIRINQTITDPDSMITRIVDEGGIEAIRANSHRYTGVLQGGVMQLKQLDDNDGTKYTDGTAATLTTVGTDVWMKLPQFYWKCTQYATDRWDFSVAYGGKPDDTYKEWDGKDLIGVYEAYNDSDYLYSISGKTSTGSVAQADFKIYARYRGDGYSLVKWKHHCMMAMLFYMYYGTTNSQAKCGAGIGTSNKTTGSSNSLGMTDTTILNGGSQSINFWGLENWWGNNYEWIDNVVVDARVWKITEDDGTTRTAGTGGSSSGWITKLLLGENIDMIPTAVGASESTGYCDYYYQSSSASRLALRSSSVSDADGGVAFAGADFGFSDTYSGGGSRLAFRGDYEIV